ncbi:MAG: DNA polymerase III subunit alpha [Streptococcaceae bacterium]|jgi:DNA polymerase-3 subunit alpha|nr:DNA polymerase III subunit alpha [Streptococcaceae bacterium]
MYVQLETKTSYSLLDSLIDIKKYVDKGHVSGYSTLGIMDNQVLYGAYKFIKYAKSRGIQPIVGLSLDVIAEQLPITLRLIAKNSRGLKDLFKISTLQMTKGRQQFETIAPLLTDIAVILPITDTLNPYELLKQLTTSFYIGVYLESEKSLLASLPEPKIPLKLVNFLQANESDAFEVMQRIKAQTIAEDTENLKVHQSFLLEASFATERFIQQGLVDFSELESLLAPISYELPKAHHLPQFSKENSQELLHKLCFDGLKLRLLEGEIYQKRLLHELDVIHQMGYDDYFLIVWDLLQFGKRKNFYTGMGRGSAVGSLVAYTLEITQIDPVKHHLLFERFLNPERFSMPDIDIDMPDIARDKFIQYVNEKYGSDFVAQIATFGTFGAKMALRDVARVFGLKVEEALTLSKVMPKSEYGRKVSLKAAMKYKPFATKINSQPIYQRIYQISSLLEGLPRHTSTHAAGVILSDVRLDEFVPLQQGNGEIWNTQFDMYDIEDIGLLKMDFLGLKNLTWVQRMRDIVAKRYQQSIDLLNLDFEDSKVLESFSSGNTLGIFQFEASGMRVMLRKMRPSRFEDMVLATSIYRPGPSQNIELFLRRRFKREEIEFYDETIADILKTTSGIILYQEQIMQIASAFAGFSLGKADLLRRAIGKKKQAEMQALRQEFVDGAQELGHSKAKAEEIYDLIERFANYGFNRSHAYAYASVAYQMMFFKVYYPTCFYQVMLNDIGNDKAKRQLFLADALDNQVQLELPKINAINLLYTGGATLQIGLLGIYGLKRELARLIYQLRREESFQDINDFILRLTRADTKLMTAENLAPLIKLGLLDTFEGNRQALLQSIDRYIENAKLVVSTNSDVEMQDIPIKLVDVSDFTPQEKLSFERELLCVQLSASPLRALERVLGFEPNHVNHLKLNQQVIFLAEVKIKKLLKTKKTNETMARVVVQERNGEIEGVLFPREYRENYQALENFGPYFLVHAKVTNHNDKLELMIRKLEAISEDVRAWIKLETFEQSSIIQLKASLRKYPGTIPVLLFEAKSRKTEVLTQLLIQENPLLIKELSELGLEIIFKKI